jgi:putative transposase
VWVTHENARAGQHVLRAAIARRGIPEVIYLDNGAPFSAGVLARSCAVLGIRLVHSRPYRPQGRGKVERLFRFIRERFLVEIEATGVASLAELNDKFAAWAESVANTRVHTETRETPIARFLSQGPPAAADPALMAEAFRWSALRVVSKTATVSLAGNRYAVDPALVGRRVECPLRPRGSLPARRLPRGQARRGRRPLRHRPPRAPRCPPGRAGPTYTDRGGLPRDDPRRRGGGCQGRHRLPGAR